MLFLFLIEFCKPGLMRKFQFLFVKFFLSGACVSIRLSIFYTYSFMEKLTSNWFAKIIFDLQIILWKMGRVVLSPELTDVF